MTPVDTAEDGFDPASWVTTSCYDQTGADGWFDVDDTPDGEEEVLYIHNYWWELVVFSNVADGYWEDECGLFDLEIIEVMM